MEITVTIKGLEMIVEAVGRLADALSGQAIASDSKAPVEIVKASEPVQIQEQAATSIPYGQQIAPHFPMANVDNAPVAVPTQLVAVQAPVQTASIAYTVEGLASAAMQLMDKGMQAQLQQLLAKFGVEALPMLPQDQYGNFATELRGLGAQI